MTTREQASPRILGGAVSDEQLRADLERYRQLALDEGASDAAILAASEVVVDERVRLKCLVPRCLRAGETPNCPDCNSSKVCKLMSACGFVSKDAGGQTSSSSSSSCGGCTAGSCAGCGQ